MSTYSLDVDAFNLYAVDSEMTLHYSQDPDLYLHTKSAQRGGTRAGVVFVELGIDDAPTHLARLDFGPPVLGDDDPGDPPPFRYDRRGGDVRMLTDAIDALTAIRDELVRMQERQA